MNLAVFVPLTKVDVVQRLVYGTMAVEQPDRSGEIMDYATAKIAIQKWSDECHKRSGGKSFGNVREMHGKVAAGALTEIAFDDTLMKVDVCARVDDEGTWTKVQKGTLTGFSIGGGYAKRWADPKNAVLKRYTPTLSEVSLVDLPCIPGATIDLIKADGVVEQIEAVGAPFEPGNDDVKAKAGDLAKAAGKPDRAHDYVVKARAELIAAHADEELAKMAPSDEELAKVGATEEDPIAELEALVKADAKKPYGDVEYADPKAGKYPIDTAAHIRAAWSYINMPKNASKVDDVEAVKAKIVAAWKAKIDSAGPPSAEKAAFIGELLKSGAANHLLQAMDTVGLEKGFYTVGRTAHLLDRMSEIAQGVIWEEAYEQDGDSTLPQGILDLMASTRSFLVDMINEECGEFFAQAERDGGDSIALLAPCLDVDGMEDMALSAKAADLRKMLVDDGSLEKVGAQISKSNMKHVQAMHDHSQAMGAKCDSGNCDKTVETGALSKMAETQDELARARRVMAAAVPQMRKLQADVTAGAEALAKMEAAHQAELAALTAQVEKLAKGPGAPKGRIFAIGKDADDKGLVISEVEKGDAPETDASGVPLDPIERRNWALAKRNGAAPGGNGHY